MRHGSGRALRLNGLGAGIMLAAVAGAGCTSAARGAPPDEHDAPAAADSQHRSVAAGAIGTRLDPARLERMRDTVRALLDRGVADSVFPGAVAVVGRRDGTLFTATAGHLDWAPSPPVDEHTIWDLASLSKVVGTTTAIAHMVERGLVDLDAPVQRYLPAWRHPGAEGVTVRHLLTHTSGLPPFRALPMDIGPDSTRKLLYAIPLDSAPGRRMAYSDIGFVLLADVAEAASGTSIDRYLRAHVFARLGMSSTTYNPPPALLARIAPTETQAFRGGQVRGIVHDERAWRLGGVAGHAGLFSSARDLALYSRMLLNEGALGDVRVLSPAIVRQFTGYVDRSFSNRALGWQKPERPAMRFTGPSSAWAGSMASDLAFGHTGFTGTSMLVDPERDLFVILLTNRVNPSRDRAPARISALRRTLADAIMSLATQVPATPATSPE